MSQHLGDQLIDYACGLLTPPEHASADAHLLECQACRAQLARHQALDGKLAAAIPAMLTSVPPRVRGGWKKIAARVPYLRGDWPASPRHGLPGFVGAGLAMTTAALLFVVMTTQALLGLGRPPLTATAYSAPLYPTTSKTPIASVTHTPERPPAVATPVVFLYTPPMQAPRPAVITARP